MLVLPLAACSWFLTPVHEDIAPGQSCGALDTDCHNGLCCGQYEDCGNGANGCFAGMCCYNADDTDTSDMGARKPHPQFAADAGRPSSLQAPPFSGFTVTPSNHDDVCRTLLLTPGRYVFGDYVVYCS